MVTCDRCHRKFESDSALLQHFRARHSNVSNLTKLEERVVAEKENEAAYRTSLHSHGPSKLKIIAFVLIVIIAIGVTGYTALVPKEKSSTTLGSGSAAPDFTLRDTSGGTFTLSDYRAKANVLLFFNEGLSCQPCLQQMHYLDALKVQFSGMNVLVVSVTTDSVDQLHSWMSAGGPQYGKVLSDPSLVAFNLYHPVGTGGSMMTHTFILINKAGIVIWRHDYGPNNMYANNAEILAAVTKAVQT